MLTDHITVRAGDTATPVRAKAFDAAGFVDLTVFASITFKMVGPVTVEGAATGDASGNLTYQWQAGQTGTIGDYEATFTGVDGSGKAQTFPQGANLRITIVAAL